MMISFQECRIYNAFRDRPDEWLTHEDVQQIANVGASTARLHCPRLAVMGLLDKLETHPALRYRLNPKPPKQGNVHRAKLEGAAAAMR